MSPPALTAGLNGNPRSGPLRTICFGDCAKVMAIDPANIRARHNSARISIPPCGCYLNEDDRETAISNTRVGRLRDRAHSEKQPDYRLRGGEDLEPGEPQARA